MTSELRDRGFAKGARLRVSASLALGVIGAVCFILFVLIWPLTAHGLLGCLPHALSCGSAVQYAAAWLPAGIAIAGVVGALLSADSYGWVSERTSKLRRFSLGLAISNMSLAFIAFLIFAYEACLFRYCLGKGD
jgi:hypothetical protein